MATSPGLSCVVSPHVVVLAGLASSFAQRFHVLVEVVLRIGMPIGAVRLVDMPGVLVIGQQSQVVYVDAKSIATEMIDDESIGYGSIDMEPHRSMSRGGRSLRTSYPYIAVAVMIHASGVLDASIRHCALSLQQVVRIWQSWPSHKPHASNGNRVFV